jgi:hypothetical protein
LEPAVPGSSGKTIDRIQPTLPFRIKMDDPHPSALAPTRSRNKVSNQSKNAKWTPEESERLMELVSNNSSPNWNELPVLFPGKSPQQIAERWEKVLNPALIKGSWTREEDEVIIRFVEERGIKDWTKLATLLPGRLGKQCRERWRNHLDPEVNRAPWTDQEDQILVDWHEKIGSKWVKIADYLPGRSDNAIKNRWNSTLSKRIEYEQTGMARPKRGRPSQKMLAERAVERAKPKSADDIPRPPRFDEIAGDVKDMDVKFDLSAPVLTPQLLSPFTGLKSPFSMMAPSMMRDLAGLAPWSPSKEFTTGTDSPFFSPSRYSLKESRADFMSLLSPLLMPK